MPLRWATPGPRHRRRDQPRRARSFGHNAALLDLYLRVPAAAHHGAARPQRRRQDHRDPHDHRRARPPTPARCRVFGLDPAVDGEEVRRRCGVVSAKPALYDRLSGWDNLLYSAELYGLGRGDERGDQIQAAAGRFGIDHALDTAGRRLLDRHEDAPRAGPLGAARARAAAVRRADLGPRPRVVARRARPDPRDDRATAAPS